MHLRIYHPKHVNGHTNARYVSNCLIVPSSENIFQLQSIGLINVGFLTAERMLILDVISTPATYILLLQLFYSSERGQYGKEAGSSL